MRPSTKSDFARTLSRLLPFLVAAFFLVLYLATCQRGWCWQDGGLFQRRILTGDAARAEVIGAYGIAAVHPLFIRVYGAVDGLCRLFGAALSVRLLATNALSCLWMASAVGLFAAAARRYAGSAKAAAAAAFALGFAHMTWWMGTICENHALEIFFFALELVVVTGWSARNARSSAVLLALLNGLHLSVHNLALVSLPVYVVLAWTMLRGERRVRTLLAAAAAWMVGALPLECVAASRLLAGDGLFATVKSVLTGSFGAEVCGLLPSSPKLFAVNAALASLSFATPLVVWLLAVRRTRTAEAAARSAPNVDSRLRRALVALFALHALFAARYFVPDQAFFILPTLFAATMLLAPRFASARGFVAPFCCAAACGLLLPALVRLCAPRTLDRGTHPGRDDVAYFALPMKQGERSCDALVKNLGLEDTWAGYLPADRASLRMPGAFPEITVAARPRVYNWWMDGAVTREGLEAQAEAMSRAGFGGVHVIQIYGAKGTEDLARPYLSERWLEALRDAIDVYGERGMEVDMTMGSGWCFGGPVDSRHGCQRVVVRDGTVASEYTRQQVKRAGLGGKGPMLDPYSPEAMTNFLALFDAAFPLPGAAGQESAPRRVPVRMYHDSWEYYGAGWTPGLLDAFRKRRGYDLGEHLGELAGVGDTNEIARVKHDYRETLSDLVVEESFPLWVAWCHARGMLTRNEAHGTPANWLDFYAIADQPETEMFGERDRDVLVSKFASSAAHFNRWNPLPCGRSDAVRAARVSAESCTWIAEHYNATLADAKRFVDALFLSGVNQIYYHGMCYSPPEAPWPGWCFYASMEMNPRNPIFRDVRTLNDYVARCQAMFQDCECDNDVLLYFPIHDWWWDPKGFEKPMTVHERQWLYDYPVGEVAKKLYAAGYGFDWVSDRMLMRLDPGKGPWKTIVVPSCDHLPEATRRRLEELSRDYEVVWCRRGEAPAPSRARPLPFAGGTSIEGMRFRRGPRAVYYLVNRGEETARCDLDLGAECEGFCRYDPMTGRVASRRAARSGDARLAHVELAGGESCLVEALRALPDADRAEAAERVDADETLFLRGVWTLSPVCGGPEPLPSPRVVEKGPAPWHVGESGEEVPFCGTMRYETVFKLSADDVAADRSVTLDLGRVCESARVAVNGTEIGCAIMAPYCLEFSSKLLRAGRNELTVEVTSTGANRLRWMDREGIPWKTFQDINMVNRDYQPLDASAWPNRPCGLIGPVSLSFGPR